MWLKHLVERNGFEELGVDSIPLSGFNWNNLAQYRENWREFLNMVKNYKFNRNPGVSCLAVKLLAFEERIAQWS